MKKSTPVFISSFLAITAVAQKFSLVVEGQTNRITPGVEEMIKLPDGQEVSVRLIEPAGTQFSGTFFSCAMDSKLSVNSAEIGEGIQQTLLTTPRGTLILVQEYDGADPLELVDMMLEQITLLEEQKNFKISKTDCSREVGGMELKGRKAVTSSEHVSWQREVLGYSYGESGLLIITAVETKNNASEQVVLDQFWSGLNLIPAVGGASVDK